MALFKVRTKAYKPLQTTLGAGNQMIVPPMAETLDARSIPVYTIGHNYVYGDIIRSGKHYYWCITVAGGNSGLNVGPAQTDGDFACGPIVWRYVRWHRDVLTITLVSDDGTISIARGQPAESLRGLVLYSGGSVSEGYSADLRPYEGAWYGFPDQAGRVIAISEG